SCGNGAEAALRSRDLIKEVTPPPFLYHYTTLHALRGIMDSQVLWATDIRYMNDASELTYGIQIARETFLGDSRPAVQRLLSELVRVEGIGDQLPDFSVFVASLSQCRDSLSQWRAYSRGSLGVAIEFGVNGIARAASDAGFMLRRCIYNVGEQ